MNESGVSQIQVESVCSPLSEVTGEVSIGQSKVDVVTPKLLDDRTLKLLKWEEIVAENILLKRELRSKLEQIASLRNQLHEVFEQHSRDNTAVVTLNGFKTINDTFGVEQEPFKMDGSGDHLQLSCIMGGGDTSVFFENTNEYEELTPNRTTSETVIDWVETNRSEVIEKIGQSLVMAKEMGLGGVAGWAAAWTLKKCGSIAVTAVGGGLLLLQLANHRGYIVVNWAQIYTQLERSTVDFEADEGDSDWYTKRFNKFKKWSKGNRNFAVGFIGGFLYYKTCA